MRGSRRTSLVAGAVVLLALVPPPRVLAASPPVEVRWPSHVGEVVFPHRLHVEDLGLECNSCHHPTRAPKLVTPHPRILAGETQGCALCHREDVKPGKARSAEGKQDGRAYRCEACHGPRTTRAGDFPGLRVALHATCGTCHEIGTGAEASASCATCHSGPPKPWRRNEGRD